MTRELWKQILRSRGKRPVDDDDATPDKTKSSADDDEPSDAGEDGNQDHGPLSQSTLRFGDSDQDDEVLIEVDPTVTTETAAPEPATRRRRLQD